MKDIKHIVEVTLSVRLFHSEGRTLTGSPYAVTFETPTQGQISEVTANGDGSYEATYTAGTEAGVVTIVALIDGVAVTQTVDIRLN